MKFLLCCLLIFCGPVRAVVILQYHHISDDTPSSTSTSPKLFTEHIRYIQEHNITVLGLDELGSLLRAGKALPDNAVVITFDDAYISIYQNAFPLLKQADFPFAIFINTAPIDEGNRQFISWSQLKEMGESGGIIANHTTNHVHMLRREKGENLTAWRSRMQMEIDETEKAIQENLGQKHRMLAYPYGEYDENVVSILSDRGYLGFGQQSGAVSQRTPLQEIPRFPMGGNYGGMNQFRLKVKSLAMPIEKSELQVEGRRSDSAVFNSGQSAVLALELNEDIASSMSCFFLGERMGYEVSGKNVSLDLPDFNAGRNRINCTARDAKTGRYYWYSHAFFIRDKNGQWQHEL
jgi:biofilm PGA synthesis lipoprotein PgaB